MINVDHQSQQTSVALFQTLGSNAAAGSEILACAIFESRVRFRITVKRPRG
jgi:hypothetical protein